MSYKYKEILKAAARDFLTGTLKQESETGEYLNLGEVEENYSDISIELDLVYARSAKSDEYEAKAEAFDRIVEQRKKTGVKTLGHYAFEIIREYESGEYDAEK